MKAHRLLKELEQVAANLGIRVRHEQLKGRQTSPGGLCILRGQRIMLLNSRMSENERLLALADVLAPLVSEEHALSEEARAVLDSRKPAAGVRQTPTRPTGPGLKRAAPRG